MSIVKKKSILKNIIIGVVLAFFLLASLLLVACKKQEELRGTLLADAQTFANANLDYADNINTQNVLPTPSNWSYKISSSANGSAPSSTANSGNIIVNDNAKEFTTKADWDNFKKAVDSKRIRQERQKYFLDNFDWKTGYIWAYLDYLEYKNVNSDKKPFYFADITTWQSIPGMPDYVKNKLLTENKDFDKSELEKRSYWAADNYTPVTNFIQWIKTNSILKQLKSNSLTADGFTNQKNSILMLSNYADDSDYGTASQYTSTAITLPAGTMARLSVDVFTALSSYTGDGANITITPTIGGNVQKSIVLNNINTKDNTNDTSNWTSYILYLQSSEYAETSFILSLGLGRQISNSALNRAEGYVFFDNVTYQVDLAKKMKDTFSTEITTQNTHTLKTTADTVVDATTLNNKPVVYNCDLVDTTKASLSTGSATQTQGNKNNINSTFNDYFKINNTPSITTATNTATPISTTANSITVDNKHDITTAINGFTGNTGIPTTLNNFINGANPSTTNGEFILKANQKAIVGMWIKSTVSTTVNLVQVNTTNTNFKNTVSSITLQTDKINAVSISDDKNGRRDNIYGVHYGEQNTQSTDEKWQYVQFFVKNTSPDNDAKFAIELQVGLTTFTQNTYLGDFSRGTAVVASPNVDLNCSDAKYNMHTANDYCKEVELATPNSNIGFNRASHRMAKYNAEKNFAIVNDSIERQNKSVEHNINRTFCSITTPLAQAKATGVNPYLPNYVGASGGSGLVGGTTTNSTANANTGILDKTSVKLDSPAATLSTLITSWKSNNTSNNPLLSSTSPLLIYGQNYGYIANKSTTLTTSSYFAINLRLLLANNAQAYIYLIDMTETEQDKYAKNILETTLGANYKYDNNGNVVTSYDNNTAQILFYIQPNGLWKTSSRNSIYYANLKNYEKQKDKKHAEYNENNLVDASGNIIYYYKGTRGQQPQYTRTNSNKDKDYVQDFSAAVDDGSILRETFEKATLRSMPASTSNVTASNNKLVATVTGTAETEKNWTDVNFFIATGSTERKYRLEVFLGSRDGNGTAVDAQHWVIYETVKYDNLTEESYNNLLNEYQNKYIAAASNKDDCIKKINNREGDFTISENGNSIQYWHYSLYDSGYYAPYNAKNTNLTGNPYSSYDPTKYVKQIAFMQFKNTNSITTIANFKSFEENVASSDVTAKPTTKSGKFQGNIPLLVISLILIITILVAVIVLLWRKFFKNIKLTFFKKHTEKSQKAAQVRTTNTENLSKPDVLPSKDEIASEDLYDFNIEDNHPNIKENE